MYLPDGKDQRKEIMHALAGNVVEPYRSPSLRGLFRIGLRPGVHSFGLESPSISDSLLDKNDGSTGSEPPLDALLATCPFCLGCVSMRVGGVFERGGVDMVGVCGLRFDSSCADESSGSGAAGTWVIVA